MRIALVHDYLKEYGGAERVLLALHEIWPEAPIYTIFCQKGSSADKAFEKVRVIESWFGKLPFCDKLISLFRFLLPIIWKSFDFNPSAGGYDLVISSASWAITKGFALRQAQDKVKEICYCHTPPRYLYGYETSRNWKKHWYVRFYALIVNHFMRMYDYNQAQKVTYFIANSREVAGRIKKFYRRESVVINPPVDIPEKVKNQISNIKIKDYYLTGGRLEAAKNFDLIIKACNRLKLPLKIYGSGTQENYLKSISGPTIEFLGRVSDEKKFNLMAESKAFIVMAKDEDFGITPVEAMASGAPVIAYRGGGYQETVLEGKTGVFVEEATAESLMGVLRDWGDLGKKIRREDCRKQAEKFSKERFKKEIINFVEKNAGIT
ncbi:glycosyltransferase family 4 protein [Candidatus Shapirobacteria bacterium CG03_land_8_20_14_0_80_40_19]|uniref:Glycosyltransferase family 4 protein n=4 Tax=Candidatus Shapironibacteriota TaxID=1752721 RepID=A0A2M7BDM9_9BACT|nr:MAG: glycosyl transferase [Candidatus Shapirobacteria bacterium CG11_big_fil_rev_8_21_14_0_20_40_12]PIV01208.1 MAG: glycosyltransferase family 4 protein [Candidatus Shapirobacteria bacterium CG03_land_8_20_14_0_80_40_19]PJC28578.1 MAG: glycosyltransferase family 4 protein [Candidatus Shapirobacteria bacterium CG_4_9_14_0_2_um_filter_40_11]PJC77545.1 MAG: glycosyltransferase family 4 protein [Candidatus Shapirobacteria bacterium CG_4_8_14_3_um_filter_39_11]